MDDGCFSVNICYLFWAQCVAAMSKRSAMLIIQKYAQILLNIQERKKWGLTLVL